MNRRGWLSRARPISASLAWVSLGGLMAACGTKGTESTKASPEPIAACEAYTKSLERCMRQLGPAADAFATPHIAAVRASFASPPADDAARAALGDACIANEKRLVAACR